MSSTSLAEDKYEDDMERLRVVSQTIAAWRAALAAGRFLNHAQTHNVLTRLLDELEEAMK